MKARKSNTPPVGAGCQGASQVHPEDKGRPLAIATCGTSIPDAGDVTPSHFDCLPSELTSRARWVLWRDGKVPYCARQPRRRASCTDPKTWASFDAALAAHNADGNCGLGFVLGDGIAAVDIDHDTGEMARFLLESVGCGYIEVSPSGDGLHGWALSGDRLPRKKGVLDGLHVEVYSADRYMTVTGRALARQPLRRTDGILRLAMSLQREAKAIREFPAPTFPESKESSESTESIEDHVEASKALGVSGEFLPKKRGERNSKIFDWCRHVKTIDPTATVQQQTRYAVEWFNAAKDVIGTKDAAVTIDDFLRGWSSALPESFDLAGVAAAASTVPVPALVADALGDHVLAYQLCVVLQREMGDKPFFMPVRTLAGYLGTSHVTAGAILRILRALGVLVVAKEHTRTTATRYYVAPEFMRGS